MRNPIDVTAQVFNDMGLIGRYLRILLDDGRYDAIALFLTSVAASESVSRPLVAELDQAMARFPGVPLVVSLTAPIELARVYESAGYALFEEPTRAVRAVSMLVRISETRKRSLDAPSAVVPRGAIRMRPGEGPHGGCALELLESWGIARGDGEAPEAVGVDVVVGVTEDPTFGPTVTLGLGGVLAEVLPGRTVRLAPFGEREAHRMIAELPGAKLFEGTPERSASDLDALAALLSRVSVLAAAETDTLTSMELDPVRVLPAGGGVVVLAAVLT